LTSCPSARFPQFTNLLIDGIKRSVMRADHSSGWQVFTRDDNTGLARAQLCSA
jgi:hypothetical protein